MRAGIKRTDVGASLFCPQFIVDHAFDDLLTIIPADGYAIGLHDDLVTIDGLDLADGDNEGFMHPDKGSLIQIFLQVLQVKQGQVIAFVRADGDIVLPPLYIEDVIEMDLLIFIPAFYKEVTFTPGSPGRAWMLGCGLGWSLAQRFAGFPGTGRRRPGDELVI